MLVWRHVVRSIWTWIYKTVIVFSVPWITLLIFIVSVEWSLILMLLLKLSVKLGYLTLKSWYVLAVLYAICHSWRGRIITNDWISLSTLNGASPSWVSAIHLFVTFGHIAISDLLLNKLLFLKPIKQWKLLKPVCWVRKHNNFISDSSKLDSISDIELVALILFKPVILVSTH